VDGDGDEGSGTKDVNHTWYESSGAASLSADQLILQKARLQSHNLVRQLAVSKAKDLNSLLARSNHDTLAKMKATIATATNTTSTSQNGGLKVEHVTGVLSVDSLGSKFEGDIKDIVESLVRYDHDYQTALATDIEHVIVDTEAAGILTEGVRSLVDDGNKIASRLKDTEGSIERANIDREASEHKRARFTQ